MKVLAPVRERLPAPCLEKPPEPESSCGILTVKPWVSTIAPPDPIVAEAMPDTKLVWSARAASVPPLKIKAELAAPTPAVT